MLIRKKPQPRGAGWYQYANDVGLRPGVFYYPGDPGEQYRKMNVEPQEDQA